jgi:predicted ATPase
VIDVFGANGFGCLKNVELKLTKLHALVGPNDSGKSTILRGIRTLSALNTGPIRDARRNWTLDFEPAFDRQNTGELTSPLLYGTADGQSYELGARGLDDYREARITPDGVRGPVHVRDLGAPPAGLAAVREFRGASIVRWAPSALRRASQQLPDSELDAFLDSGGEGLPAMYGRLAYEDPKAWIAMQERVASLFPSLRTFNPKPVNGGGVGLEFTLRDGQVLGAAGMSDGIMYFLAFAALERMPKPRIFLLEEPENGLHPARIGEVVAMLRKLDAQVIMATHSPLILNELQPEEVTVVTRTPEEGTRVTPIAATKNFADRIKVYALGELWVSYCDGVLEKPLLEGLE